MKEKENPNHHMGKRTGYELIDGVYHIAPFYQEEFNELAYKRKGIGDMLKIVSSHAANDLEQLSKSEQKIWKDLREDIGLSTDKPWQYFSNDGTVRETKATLQ